MLGPRSAFWGECVHLWLTRKGLYFLEHYFIITKAPNTVHVNQHQKHASLVHQLGLKPLPLRCWNRPVGVIASNPHPRPPPHHPGVYIQSGGFQGDPHIVLCTR